MDKISIIIPVFNTGHYLRRCIESVKSQTYHNLEIIIVDDGSLKETSDICEKLASTDKRINLFHKKNEGVSIARNYGLAKATGRYIGFIDSDDWVDLNMFEKLYTASVQNNADIVYCDSTTVWNSGKLESDTFTLIPQSQLLKKEDITPSVLCEMAGSVWRGLYKRDIIKGVEFPINLKFSEDRIFNLYAINQTNSIYYLKEKVYFRFMRKGSCVMSYHPDAIATMTKAFDIMCNYTREHFGDAYFIEYDKMRINSFIGYMYDAFLSSKSIVGKYKEVKLIASNPTIQRGVQKYHLTDIRLLFAVYHQFLLLFLLLRFHIFIKGQ